MKFQRSKGARSFRGQKIIKPGHPETGTYPLQGVHFFLKKLTTFFRYLPQNTGRQRTPLIVSLSE